MTSKHPYNYSYVLNNPLRFTDPSGYMYEPKDPKGVAVNRSGEPTYQYLFYGSIRGDAGNAGWGNTLGETYYNLTNTRPPEAGYGFDYYYIAVEDEDGNIQYVRRDQVTSIDFCSFFADLESEMETDDFHLGLTASNGAMWITGLYIPTHERSSFQALSELNYMDYAEASVFSGSVEEKDYSYFYFGAYGIATTLGKQSNSTFRLFKGGKLSPKLYSSGWKGGSIASIKTFSAAKTFHGLGLIGNLVGLVPNGWDMIENGINSNNFTDFMISSTAFATGGFILSPIFKWYAEGIREDIRTAPDGGASVIERLEFSTSGYPGAQCFAEGTQVLMGDGSIKAIELVQIGETVITYNFSDKKFEKNPVTKVTAVVHNKLVKVNFSNGVEIISTEDHPYFVKGKGWCSFNPEQTFGNYGMKTKQLKANDVCLTYRGKKVKEVSVLQIIPLEKSINTYNLKGIANSNNFFANGILVNNESSEIP